jgi:hypothetical protein
MFKFIASIMLFLSLVVSPFGQMTAFAAHECDMTMMTQDSMMHHSMAQAESMPSTEAASMDCCDVECVCPLNACHAFTYVSQSMQSLRIFSSFEKIQTNPQTPPVETISNLYRPPIFA